MVMINKHDDPMERMFKNLCSKVKQFGWTSIGTFIDDNIPMTYTIGLNETYNHPDLIMIGCNHQASMAMFTLMIKDIKEKNRQHCPCIINDLFRSQDDKKGYKGALIPVSWENAESHMTFTYLYYIKERFKALQVVWPDKENRFPFEDGFDMKQPLLIDDYDFSNLPVWKEFK